MPSIGFGNKYLSNSLCCVIRFLKKSQKPSLLVNIIYGKKAKNARKEPYP